VLSVAVNIGIAIDAHSLAMRAEPVVTLGDDGYYWFLHPLFVDLASRTGQYIDLYGDAAFAGPALDALGDTTERARRLVEEQPDSWQVHVGTQTAPVHKEVYSGVEGSTFRQLLERLSEIVATARGQNGRVVCFGD
jgi:hypothetical protein